MLAHSVFFETLASINDETAPDWKPIVAGLVVLRLIDDWIDIGAQIVTTDVTGLRAIRESINAVSEGNPIRAILSGVVDTLEQAETVAITSLTPQLIAYGRALDLAGKWKLSKDVFATLLNRAEAIADDESCIPAAMQLGIAARRLGEFDEADSAYIRAEESANRLGSLEDQLIARLGCAQVVISRGNLPKADDMIAEIITAAEQQYTPRVLADALHNRAHLRILQRDYSAAIRFGYSALEFTDYAISKERILADMAAAFAELGYLSAAKDAHLIVAAITQDAWVRHQTFVNLMEIAIWEAQEPSFHQYRQLLSEATLNPELQTYFHLYAGRGYKIFGDQERAKAELEQAAQIASAYSFNQLRMLIEEEIDKPVAQPVSQPTQEWSKDLKDIATAIGNLRHLTTQVDTERAPV